MMMMMSFIPDSLIFEFLVKLPVKSLTRFKCINKQCYSLISGRHFIYTHLKRSKIDNYSNLSCLILSCISNDNLTSSIIHFFTIQNHGVAALEYSAQVSFDSYNVLPSCNGLVCFYGSNDGFIHICNPCTKKIMTLPHSESSTSFSSCGFGFDFKTFTHEVIQISENCIEVFILGGISNSWRRLKNYNVDRFRFLYRQSPVYANGFFYWVTHNSSRFSIVSFQIGSEIFGVIDPPKSVSGKDWQLLSLAELGDELCLVDIDFELEGNRRMDIWFFNKDGDDRWVQKTITHPTEAIDAARPVAVHGGQILLHGFIKGFDCNLNWYDFGSKRFRQVVAIKGNIPSPFFHVNAHVETLVPLSQLRGN